MKIIKKIAFYLCISITVINFTSCKEEKKLSPVSLEFPEPTLLSSQKELVTLPMKNDKVKLIVFWATWCQPCLMEIPSLIDLQKELSGQPFEILGLSVDEEDPFIKVNRVIEQYQLNYPVYIADEEFQKKIGGIDVLPTSYLVDQKGIILRKWYGPQTKFRFLQEIRKHLPGQPSA